MTRDAAWLADRMDLLEEITDIGEALDAAERRHGPQAAIEDARHRTERIHAVVLEQVRSLLDAANTATTVH